MIRKRCPNGTRRNKKTNNCEVEQLKDAKKRCPNGTRRNKKTNNCDAKTKKLKTVPLHKSNVENVEKVEKKNNLQLNLTKANLIALGLRKETPPMQRNSIIRPPKQMSDKKRQQMMELYNSYWNGFLENEDNEIYDYLKKVAKKQYSKDSELAQFEEKFYQHFLQNDEKYNKKYNNMYDEKLHNNLVKMREKVDGSK